MNLTMPEKFKYQPLPKPTSIRLVSIIPREDPTRLPPTLNDVPLLHLSLSTVDLQNAPHYHALSYTWGAPFPPEDPRSRVYEGVSSLRPVLINDRMHYIGRNLWEFLDQQQQTNASLTRQVTEMLESEPGVDGLTPLMSAVRSRNVEMTEALLALEADISAQDKHGNTVLHHATADSDSAIDLTRLLVSHGVDIHVRNHEGKTAFDEVTADAIALVYSPINSLARTTVLKGLRLSPECPMWIDSISINQGDIPERNQQVSLISEIYSKANSVAIWLGVEDEYAPAGLTALTSSWEERFGPWLSYTFVKSDCETHQEAIEIMKGHNLWTDQDLWDCLAIGNLMDRTWWSRIWVIQELALAKHTEVICGEFKLHSHDTARIFSYLCVASAAGMSMQYGQPAENFDAHFEDVRFGGVRGIEAFMLANIAFRTPAETEGEWGFIVKFVLRQRGSSPDSSWGRRLSLQNLLRLSWWFQSSDPRDKIFALRGISYPDSQVQQIPADYSTPVGDVFVQYGRLFMQGSPERVQAIRTGDYYVFECLEGLSYVQHNTNAHPAFPDYVKKLPSWTPNFSTPLTTCRIWSQKFRAASDIDVSPVILPHPNPRILGVTGHIVDEIVATENTQHKGNTYESGVMDWIELIHNLHPIYAGEGNRVEALWRTLTADQGEENAEDVRSSFRDLMRECLRNGAKGPRLESILTNLRESDSFRTLPSFQELLHPSPEEDNTTGVFQLLLTRYYRSRILFRTKRGYIGLGPERLQPGDEVWLFAKARTPFILRQREGTAFRREIKDLFAWTRHLQKGKSSSSGDAEYRTLIGETYVHGIMKGEAMCKGDFHPVFLV